MLLVAALGIGYVALMVGVMALGRAAALGDRAREATTVDWLDFYGGGPLDGDRKQIEAGRSEWLCVVPRAVLSPWGQEDRDPMANIYGHIVTGRYVRTPEGMAWRGE